MAPYDRSNGLTPVAAMAWPSCGSVKILGFITSEQVGLPCLPKSQRLQLEHMRKRETDLFAALQSNRYFLVPDEIAALPSEHICVNKGTASVPTRNLH